MNTVVKQERRNPVKIVLLMFCACLIALSGVAFSPQQAHAETWQQYLSRMWSDFETKFANLDKSTGLMSWDGISSVKPVTGDGTASNPYLINNPSELRWVCSQPDNALKSFKLLADLDLGGEDDLIWSPTALVNTTEPIVMDGNGHTIYNMKLYGGTSGYTSYGLGFVSYNNNPNFEMKNLSFRYADVRANGGTQGYSVAVANFRAGAITNVAVIDSLVKGNDFVGALAVGWSIGDAYKAVDGAGDPINSYATRIDQCRTERVYTYGASCIGNFTGPLWGSYVSNSYAVDGVTVSTAGHSGGFVSCPGYDYVENCYCNITMYGNSQTSVFSGVNHFNNGFKNCVASGVVEGSTTVGGFLGDGSSGGTSALPS